MGIRQFLIVFGFLIGSYPLNAQIQQPLRMEVDMERYEDAYRVMSMEENGIVLFRQLDELSRGNKKIWEVVKLDTMLVNVFTQNYELNYNAELAGYEYRDGFFYMLYRMGEYSKDDLKIIKIDMRSGRDVQYDIKQIVPINLTEFTIIGNAALLGGYVNYRPAMIHYSFEKQKIKVLPGIYKNKSELLELNVHQETNTFTVLLTEQTREKLSTIAVKRFNADGDLLQNTMLEPLPNSSIIYGQTVSLPGERQFIVGTYANRRSNYSRGIYIAELGSQADGPPQLKYYNYGDLKNFFNYMKAKRVARVKNRVERRKIKGKKLRFNYRLVVHDVVKENGKFLMIGEAYYPKFSSHSLYGYYSGYRNMAFEGYKYTHAVIIAFDPKGNILYDNSFEINDVTSYQLEQLVSVNVQDGKLVLLYTYDNVIRSKIVQGDEVLEGKVFNDIELAFENDIVGNNDSEVGGLKKWYGDYFFAYGVQRIKNLGTVNTNPTREVFFINKVYYSFDPVNAETSAEIR